MPRLIFQNEEVAVIECQYIPLAGQREEEAMAQIEKTICAKCGFLRDSDLRAKQRMNQSQGKLTFRISCLSPQSPYLAPLKEELRKTGKIK